NLTLQRGAHTLTLGTHNELYGIQYFFQNAWNGRWQYSSIANFLANKPSRIRGTYKLGDNSYGSVAATPSADFKVLWPSAYVQDEIAVSDRLHVTPGLRVDYPMFPDKPNPNPAFLATQYRGTTPFAQYDEHQIGGNVYLSPRVAFNWDVRGDESLQLRGGTGIFTGRVPFAWYAYAYYNNGVRFNNVDCRPGPTAGCAGNSAVVPLVPGEQLSTLQSGVYEMNVIDNHFKLPTVERTSLGADWRFGRGTTLTMEGMYTKSLQDVKFLNVGLKDSTVASPVDGRPVFLGSPVALRVNPNITSVFLLTNTKGGDRYSLTGQVAQVLGSFRGSVAYTYGESRDVSNGIRNSPQSNWEYNQVEDPRDPRVAYSNFDLRHRVVANLSWDTEWRRGFRFGASLFYSGVSGSPFTFTYVNDYNRDGSSNNDLIYVPLNQADARIVPASGDARTADQIWAQLNSFIESQPGLRGHRGQIVPRNAGRTPWNHEVDLRLSQDLPAIGRGPGHGFQLTLDVINLGAVFSSKWGRQYFVPNENNYNFPTLRVTKTDAQGLPVGFSFDGVKNNTPWQYDPLNSRYQAQLGLRYSF
ncbi:MAG: TonB-dependent receptor, partial [Gemmatimonadetes bacterium]|nr:TonB-dependent receptor [Gemmatimonadota bacterium]